MKSYILILATIPLFFSCGDKNQQSAQAKKQPISTPKSDDGKGIGETKSIELNNPLLGEMVERGEKIYNIKCAACHKLSDQRVVGPGWKDITTRRKPEWIMNMTTNVEEMLEKDPAAKEMLKECLVRMPNQNLSVADARDVLEFMYANDGHKVGG